MAPPLLTGDQVLHIFQREAIDLFLGAVFVAVGLVAGSILLFRRKSDPLLLWFAIFAFLYGFRLWLWTTLLSLMTTHIAALWSLRQIVNYAMAIPAFFFFRAAGYLGKMAKLAIYPLIACASCLVFGVILFGPLTIFSIANNVAVVVALLLLVFDFLQQQRHTPEFKVLSFGLLTFVALAIWNNILGYHARIKVEPFGFAIFLWTLGYVAVQRNIERDTRLAVVQKELDVAEQIQHSILPAAFPESANFQVAVRYVPMRTVAGDFYDFLQAKEAEAGLLIADVSGHGVPAALIASMVKLAAASQAEHAADPAAFLGGMNHVLCGNTQHQFVTAAYVHLDAVAAQMRYAAAAHPPILLVRDGEVSELAENGLMMGIFDTATYNMATRPLRPGDRLLLYTDGIVEAANANEEEFGRERLHRLLREGERLSNHALADLILRRVREWAAEQDDDLTLLVCDYQRASA